MSSLIELACERLSASTSEHAALNDRQLLRNRIKTKSGEHNMSELNAKLEHWRRNMLRLNAGQEE